MYTFTAPIKLLFFLFNRSPNLACIIRILRICGRITLYFYAARLIFACREKFRTNILIHLLKRFWHFAYAFEHGICVCRDCFNRQVIFCYLSAVVMCAYSVRKILAV